jgi:hypothetical protein
MRKHANRRVVRYAPVLFVFASQQAALAFEPGDKPFFLVGPIVSTHYDGTTNDLLTAGLGQSGLGSATAPSVSSPPTVEELRRLAIYTNYRALVDPTPGGGFGLLYGPASPATGPVANAQGQIPGTEILALSLVRSRHADVAEAVTIMVQIPDSYDPAKGCIVAAPSSGSRGVYGAIATAGEWGLKHGCAVAYTDKGTGTGAHDLHNDTVNLLRGDRALAPAAGLRSNFTAPIGEGEREAFDASHPNRFAYKHAHSEANPEADWGAYVLQAVQFAYYELNQKFSPGNPHGIDRRNTIVIASSVSNGGGASLPNRTTTISSAASRSPSRTCSRFGCATGASPSNRETARRSTVTASPSKTTSPMRISTRDARPSHKTRPLRSTSPQAKAAATRSPRRACSRPPPRKRRRSRRSRS